MNKRIRALAVLLDYGAQEVTNQTSIESILKQYDTDDNAIVEFDNSMGQKVMVRKNKILSIVLDYDGTKKEVKDYKH